MRYSKKDHRKSKRIREEPRTYPEDDVNLFPSGFNIL